VKLEQRAVYSQAGRLFQVHATVEVRELVTEGESIPASATDIRPEHRQEIIAVMRTLAERISKGEVP
jgi:hypothetical protein